MFIDCHILRNLAPSSLNRDDTGSPKTTVLGGVRRAAISSQALKRAMRMYIQQNDLVPPAEQAVRTRRLVLETASILAESYKRDREQSVRAAEALLASMGLKADEKHQTQYLLFIPKDAPERLAKLINDNFDGILDALGMINGGEESGEKGRKRRADAKKVQKIAARSALPEAVIEAVEAIFEQKTIIQAAFGRMLADLTQYNIDAFVSVARAVGTNRLITEHDYVAAVDDLLSEAEKGSGFLGIEEYNSSCVYQFMTISVRQALENLNGDQDRVRAAIAGLMEAFAFALPSGKKNAFPTWVNPALMMVVVRKDSPLQLTNAFDVPVSPTSTKGLAQRSIEALDAFYPVTLEKWNRNKWVVYTGVVWEGPAELKHLNRYEEPDLETMINKAIAAAL